MKRSRATKAQATRPRATKALVLLSSVIGLMFLLPLVYLFIRAFEGSPAQMLEYLLRPRTFRLFANTLALTLGVLAISTAMALPLALFLSRVRLPGGRVWTWLAVMPLTIPGYVMAYALISMGGAYGLPARLLGWVWRAPGGYWGAALALSLYSFPYLFLNVRSALLDLDPGLEESARSLGHSPRSVFWHVGLPHLKPALLSGWLVIALYTLGDFGVVALMRYEVFSYAIYTQYSSAFNRSYAALLSLLLLFLTTLLVGAEGLFLGRGRYVRAGTGSARKRRLVKWSAGSFWSWAGAVHLVLVLLMALGLPFLTLFLWLVMAPPRIDWLDVGLSFARSFGAAGPAAVLGGLTALPVMYLRTRYPGRFSRLLEKLAYGGYAMPPLALALALVFFSLSSARFLYQGFSLLIFAYTLNFTALAMGPLRNSLLQASPRLKEAAQSLGRSRSTIFLRITFPLLRRGLFSGMALIFVMVMKELPITFLLAPTGYVTLAVKVFSRTSEGMLAQAAPYALLVVISSALFVGLIFQAEGGGQQDEDGRQGGVGRQGNRRQAGN